MNKNNNSAVNNAAEVSISKEVTSFMKLMAQFVGDWKKTARQTVTVCLMLLATYTCAAALGHMVAKSVIEKKWAEVTVLDRHIENLSQQAEKAQLVIQQGNTEKEALAKKKREVAALQQEQQQAVEILAMVKKTLEAMHQEIGSKTQELVGSAIELTEAKQQIESVRGELAKMADQRSELAATMDKAKEMQAASLAKMIEEAASELASLSAAKDEVVKMEAAKEAVRAPAAPTAAAKESFISKVKNSVAALQSSWSK